MLDLYASLCVATTILLSDVKVSIIGLTFWSVT